MTKKILKFLQYLSIGFIGIGLVAGCAQNQVKPWDNNSLSQITFSFADIDNDEGEIGGDITLDLPAALKPAAVTNYIVYWGSSIDASGKGAMLADVPAADFTSSVLYTIPENSPIVDKYFLLFLKGKEGPEIYSGKASLAADKFEGVEVPVVTDVTQPPPTKEEEPQVADQPAVETPQASTETTTPTVVTPQDTPTITEQPQVVTVNGETIVVTIKNVLFDFDKSYLRNEFKEQLRNDFDSVASKDQVKLLIAGHADERGSNEYNLALGERRAFAVKRYLISLGFQADNIRIISYGEEKPIDRAHNEAAWAKNRRSESEIQ